jgi:hypothetical protein
MRGRRGLASTLVDVCVAVSAAVIVATAQPASAATYAGYAMAYFT